MKTFSYSSIIIDSEVISCYSTTNDISNRKLLLLHGAWLSDKKRLIGISKWFSERWIESVGFDFSGHGESTKNTSWSIKKRVLEAEYVIENYFSPEQEIFICAFSMSGQVVYELLRKFGFRIQKCFLCAPALYHQDAIDMPFWENFSRILRTNGSYRNHGVSDILWIYRGSIVIIMWSDDRIIPKDVPEIIMEAHTWWENKKIVLQGAPHMLAGWTMESPENMNRLCKIIFDEMQ
jgi:uncharacterized protein